MQQSQAVNSHTNSYTKKSQGNQQHPLGEEEEEVVEERLEEEGLAADSDTKLKLHPLAATTLSFHHLSPAYFPLASLEGSHQTPSK